MAPIAVVALALPATAAISTSAVNTTMFSSMLRCARLARPAKPVYSGSRSRLPASVVRPTTWLAAAAAITTWTAVSTTENKRYFRSGLMDRLSPVCPAARLLGAEEAISRITKAGDNIPVVVELGIDRGCEYRHVGMDLGEGAGARLGRQDADHLDAPRAGLHQSVDAGDRRMRGGQHRIAHDHVAVAVVARHLEVVLDRLQRPRVAIEADMADAGERHQVVDALGEAKACAQNRRDHQLLAVEQRRVGAGDRRLDVRLHQGEVACRVVAQQQADLAQQAAEVRARGLLVEHLGELVLHQRMADDVDRRRQGHDKAPLFRVIPSEGSIPVRIDPTLRSG